MYYVSIERAPARDFGGGGGGGGGGDSGETAVSGIQRP